MLLGMTALGEGGGPLKGSRTRMAVSHMAGGVVGGASVAAVAWLLATPVRTLVPAVARVGIVVAVAALAVLIDLGLVRKSHRLGQVPRDYARKWGMTKAYALYGARFGAAFTTLVPYAATYTLFAALTLTLPLGSAALGGALFGLGRTILIGPGSLVATRLSSFLFRGSGVRQKWIAVSFVLSALLAATQLGTL
jgi:hypothetical protein